MGVDGGVGGEGPTFSRPAAGKSHACECGRRSHFNTDGKLEDFLMELKCQLLLTFLTPHCLMKWPLFRQLQPGVFESFFDPLLSFDQHLIYGTRPSCASPPASPPPALGAGGSCRPARPSTRCPSALPDSLGHGSRWAGADCLNISWSGGPRSHPPGASRP